MKKLTILVLLFTFMILSCGKDENPINTYYKNIPMIQGMTQDEKPKVYNVKIDLGYENGNKKIQTELNKRKIELTDLVRMFLSSLTEEQFLIDNQDVLKEKIRKKINEILIEGEIIEVYMLELQVFDYN
ncbi:MAG: flagellar basal body-associated FliL family protein [Spirochaetaceae bacterium]|jgi:flagellar basal body-associated protein FliL|nr:flagellar basal body-associated FliL family protein [Spirochaetaceae bacterium]